MPVLYSIDRDRQFLLYSGFGQCTGEELVRAEAEARRDPRRTPGMRILLNLREIGEFDVSMDDLQRGVEMNSALAAGGWELEKTAVLIRSPMDEIMAEVYDGMAMPDVELKMAIFQTLQPALAWLGMPEHRQDVENLIVDLSSRFSKGGGGH